MKTRVFLVFTFIGMNCISTAWSGGSSPLEYSNEGEDTLYRKSSPRKRNFVPSSPEKISPAGHIKNPRILWQDFVWGDDYFHYPLTSKVFSSFFKEEAFSSSPCRGRACIRKECHELLPSLYTFLFASLNAAKAVETRQISIEEAMRNLEPFHQLEKQFLTLEEKLHQRRLFLLIMSKIRSIAAFQKETREREIPKLQGEHVSLNTFQPSSA